VSIFVSRTPVVTTSVDSPVVVILVSPSEESDTSAIDSSSATFEPADSSWISFDIASKTEGLESVESISATTALEISSNIVISAGSDASREISYPISPLSPMSVTMTVDSLGRTPSL